MTVDSAQPDFQFVCNVADLAIGKSRRVAVEGTPVALFHLTDGFFAIEDACSHQGGSLAFGDLKDNVIACPRHGALFDVKTGQVKSLPAIRGVRSYPVRLDGDRIFIGTKPASEAAPSLLRLR